jgi:hypothetical protein
VSAVGGLAGCLGFAGGRSPEEQATSYRDELSKYTDVARAKEDGYQMTTPYVRTDEGILGMPFFNRDVPELEPEQPSVKRRLSPNTTGCTSGCSKTTPMGCFRGTTPVWNRRRLSTS